MSIAKKDFPEKLFVRIVEEPAERFYMANETVEESGEEGELVAIYECKEILKKKVTHNLV